MGASGLACDAELGCTGAQRIDEVTSAAARIDLAGVRVIADGGSRRRARRTRPADTKPRASAPLVEATNTRNPAVNAVAATPASRRGRRARVARRGSAATSGCAASTAGRAPAARRVPRPWISRTSVKPASRAASRYDSTTEGMSRGANGCRSIASSIGTTTGGSSSSSAGHRPRRGTRPRPAVKGSFWSPATMWPAPETST